MYIWQSDASSLLVSHIDMKCVLRVSNCTLKELGSKSFHRTSSQIQTHDHNSSHLLYISNVAEDSCKWHSQVIKSLFITKSSASK